jgi:hypothetical protein
VAQQSGLSHVAMMTGQADVAVLSRAPLRDPQERILDQHSGCGRGSSD